MKRRNNKGIATWLKWLLGIMAVGFVLCLATCGTIAFIGFQGVKDAMDPEKAKGVAASVADIKELPPTYKYSFGWNMMDLMTMVAVQNTAAKITYMIIKVPNADGMTADQFVERMATEGVPTAGGGAGQSKTTIEVKEKGKTRVGNVEMPYIIGISENSNTGKKQPAFLGCVMPSADSAVLICAASEEEGKPIDMNEVNGFLSNITSFKATK